MRQYLTRREIAERYPVSFSTLAHLAVEGRGPPYSIVGKKAIYDAIKVEQWIDSQQVDLSGKTANYEYKALRRGRPRKAKFYGPPRFPKGAPRT